MHSENAGSYLLTLLSEIIFLLIAVSFHVIFAIIALLPEAIFEGSALRKWTKTSNISPCCHLACLCHKRVQTSSPTCHGRRTPLGTCSQNCNWRSNMGRGPRRLCRPRRRQFRRPPAGRPTPRPCSTRQQSPLSCRPPSPQSLRARLEQHLLPHLARPTPSPPREDTPPPPYSAQEIRRTPTSATREQSLTASPRRPRRARRRTLAQQAPLGGEREVRERRTVVQMIARASPPPPLLNRQEAAFESESENSSQ